MVLSGNEDKKKRKKKEEESLLTSLKGQWESTH